jgi:hypothetical protein
MAAPIPREAPVTIAILFWLFMFVLRSLNESRLAALR